MTAYVPSKSLGVATTTSVGILALAFCRSTTFGALQPLAQPCLPRARIGLARRPGSRRQSQRLLGARPHPWAPPVIMPLAKRVPLGHAAVLGEAALPSPGAMTRALLLQPQARMRYFLATATGKSALPLQPPSQCQIEFGCPRRCRRRRPRRSSSSPSLARLPLLPARLPLLPLADRSLTRLRPSPRSCPWGRLTPQPCRRSSSALRAR